MMLNETKEFCLCRKPIIPQTGECADQCRTYVASFRKTYWSVKIKKFCLYKDTSNWFSRIQLDKIVDKDIYFKVCIGLDLPSNRQGEFFSSLSKELYSWHGLKPFIVDYNRIEYRMTLQEYGPMNVPMYVPLKRATDFIPSLYLLVKIDYKSELDNLRNHLTDLNFGLHLELSNKDNPIPWIEKL